ncbi:MAG: cob(I)yrinic acid a,c-diamide adenosyltransferase [Bacillota bacterium]
MSRVYTKTGDAGTTGLFGGTRVHKDSLRLHCYGTIDEANSMIGLAYSLSSDEEARCRLNAIQRRLFSVAAELASDEKGFDMLKDRIGADDITYLEGIIDACMDFVGDSRGFAVPGVNSFSAALHSARTVVRRAERHIVELHNSGEPVRDELRRYINRLSDCLFALARREEELVKVRMIKDKVVEKLNAVTNGCAPRLDLNTARKLALYAEEKAREINLSIVFAAVDQGGNLILANRMEGALIASIDIAMKKAYTANALKLPTDVAGELSKPDAPLRGLETTNDNRFVLFGGGFPYAVNGEVVGGIGVSGGTVEQDMEIATYALNKIQGRDE